MWIYDFTMPFYSQDKSVNKALQGKWASLACHETGSLVVQVRLIVIQSQAVRINDYQILACIRKP